jgi:hypothetical protein
MKLIAYKTSPENCQKLVPAARTRQWMDETPSSFAYHCLPLVMANSLGWFLINDVACEMEWNGSAQTEGVKIWADDDSTDLQKKALPLSHFGSGIVTFHVGYIFRTEEKISLLAKGPANNPKHGIVALEGLVETDWLPYPFTINWKMTLKNVRVRFERGEPIAQIIPYPSDLIGRIEPVEDSLESDPELRAKYEDYSAKRTHFNAQDRGTKRQKYYIRGQDSLGNQYPENHLTDWKTRPFVPKVKN